VAKGSIKTAQQLQGGLDFLKGKSQFNTAELETASGVGKQKFLSPLTYLILQLKNLAVIRFFSQSCLKKS
jgi:hypothetical protein